MFLETEASFPYCNWSTKMAGIIWLGSTSVQHVNKVDTWKQSYDSDDNLIEEEGGKKQMIEVEELKYLGFVVASSASNVPNILDRQKKLISTPNNILKMTRGLGSYTLESGLIYFNSLRRASLLYACETYVNLSEREYLLVESVEDNCLIKLLDTGRN